MLSCASLAPVLARERDARGFLQVLSSVASGNSGQSRPYLDDLTCADEATRMRARDEAEDLLRTQWSSSVIGFHSCRQALLEKALIRSSSRTGLAASWARGGEQRDAFALGDLLASICRPPGDFEVRVDAPDVEISANRVLLEAILFNALQNARAHGGEQRVRVGAMIVAGQLVIEAENPAGAHQRPTPSTRPASVRCFDTRRPEPRPPARARHAGPLRGGSKSGPVGRGRRDARIDLHGVEGHAIGSGRPRPSSRAVVNYLAGVGPLLLTTGGGRVAVAVAVAASAFDA